MYVVTPFCYTGNENRTRIPRGRTYAAAFSFPFENKREMKFFLMALLKYPLKGQIHSVPVFKINPCLRSKFHIQEQLPAERHFIITKTVLCQCVWRKTHQRESELSVKYCVINRCGGRHRMTYHNTDCECNILYHYHSYSETINTTRGGLAKYEDLTPHEESWHVGTMFDSRPESAWFKYPPGTDWKECNCASEFIHTKNSHAHHNFTKSNHDFIIRLAESPTGRLLLLSLTHFDRALGYKETWKVSMIRTGNTSTSAFVTISERVYLSKNR